ncbi:hypothetical protein ACVPOS_11705 [Staphylococcus aureus]
MNGLSDLTNAQKDLSETPNRRCNAC